MIVAIFCCGVLIAGVAPTLFGQDVGEVVEDTKDTAKNALDKGKKKAKELKEQVTDESFWEQVPPYLALPGALLVGLLLGFLLGKRGGNKKQK
jgi:ElaB/YqjD/DUF883 family membrane-anchored ribosome-binding protein